MIVGLLASMGLPGFVGFVAELHTLTGGFQRFGLWIGLASVGVLIGAAAALRTISLVFMGPVKHGGMGDLSVAELVAAAPLVALTVGLGLFPNLALSVMAPTVLRLAALFPVVVS
jgi:NADH-quinone oxidoreductase subunit M